MCLRKHLGSELREFQSGVKKWGPHTIVISGNFSHCICMTKVWKFSGVRVVSNDNSSFPFFVVINDTAGVTREKDLSCFFCFFSIPIVDVIGKRCVDNNKGVSFLFKTLTDRHTECL